jgi:hypothetical protein
MTINVNSGSPAPLAAQDPVESQPLRKVQTAGRSKDLDGAPQSGAPGTGPVNAGGAPALPSPNLTAVDMMLQLTALMSKVADLTTITQEETIKKERVDMKLVQEKRMADMKVYYEKMAESSELNTGFFAHILRGVVSLFKGQMDDARDQFGSAFTGNVGTAITLAVAVVGFATPVGLLAGLFLACAFLEDEACTYELFRLGCELTTGREFTPEQRDMVKTIASVFKWIGTGTKIAVGIGLAVIGIVAASVVGVVVAPFTGGFGGVVAGGIVSALVATIAALAAGGTTVESSVRGSQATLAQAEAWDKSAEADKAKAQTEAMMGKMKSNMTHLQDIFDNLQALISSLTGMMRQQQQGSASAAQAV